MSDEASEQRSNNSLFDRIHLSETLILASIPIIAYLLVFIFESGYLSVFQLPTTFITFDFTSIFVVTGALLALGTTIYYYGDTFYEAIRTSPDPVQRRLRKVFPSIVIFWALFFIYSELWREWVYSLATILVLTLPSFVMPLITQRKVKGYLAKLRAADEIDDQKVTKKDDWESPFHKLIRFLGPQLLLFLLGLYMVYNAGRATALRQVNFHIVSTSPERVVLWMTNNYVVCAAFDRTAKEVEPSFVVLNFAEDPNLEFRLQKIGPLKLRPLPTSPTIPPTSTATSAPLIVPSSTATTTSTLAPKSSQLPAATQSLTPIPQNTLTPSPTPLPSTATSVVKP
jgi:hypothetical protein